MRPPILPPFSLFPRRRLSVALAATALLGGCTHLDVPLAHNYPASSQPKARSAHHWDVLATDVAQRIANRLSEVPTQPGDTTTTSAGNTLVGQTLRLSPAPAAPFQRAFHALLTHRLVNLGVTLVQAEPKGQIDVDVQVIDHASRVGNGSPLASTQLAASVAVVRDWVMYSQTATTGVLSGLALGALSDASRQALQGSAAGGPTRTEVLVTTRVTLQGRLAATTADIYYIEAEDSALYLPPPEALAPPAPAPIKTWTVVAP